MNNIPMDVLNLSFTVEDWLDSDTAELTIDIDASVDGDSLELRSTIKDSLKELIDVEWRFVRVNRHTDRTGREAWQVSAQARVDESEISNLGARTKKLGRVGLQYRIGMVDYSPTQEQVEELNRSLRAQVNVLISDELDTLNNDELKGRFWRVSSVNYDNSVSYSNSRGIGASPQIMAMASSQSYTKNIDFEEKDDDGESGGFGGFEISQKVVFTANVALSSTVPGFDSNS